MVVVVLLENQGAPKVAAGTFWWQTTMAILSECVYVGKPARPFHRFVEAGEGKQHKALSCDIS